MGVREELYLDKLPEGYRVGKFKVIEDGKTVRIVVRSYHFFPNPKKEEDRRPINPKYIVKHGYKVIIYRR